jgi:hypothetical protein
MAEVECDDYDDWQGRAVAAGGPLEPLIKFATWYPPVIERWLAVAAGAGVWEQGPEPGRSGREYCRHASETLAHAERSDGAMVHFVIDTVSRPYSFRAR